MESYSLSPQQKRLWLLDGQTCKFYSKAYVELPYILDSDTLIQSIEQIYLSNEILKTNYHINEQFVFPLQVVGSFTQFTFNKLINDEVADDLVLEKVKRYYDEAYIWKYDDIRIDINLLEFPGRCFLMVKSPAISLDHRSVLIFLQQVLSFYNGINTYTNNTEVSQYTLYSEWTNQNLESDVEEVIMSATDYELVENLSLETEIPSQTATEFNLAVKKFEISHDELDEIASQYETDVSKTMFAVWNILLYRFSLDEVFISGIFDDNRLYEPFQNALGLYGKILPVKIELNNSNTIEDVLISVSNTIESIEPYIDYFFLGYENSKLTTKFLPYVFEYADYSISDLNIVDCFSVIEQFKIKLDTKKLRNKYSLEFQYNSNYFSAETINSFGEALVSALKQLKSAPNTTIGRLDLQSLDKKKHILDSFTGHKASYEKDLLINEIFEQNVISHLDKIAVCVDDKYFTYKSINERSNQLAWHLSEKMNLKCEEIVGVWAERSELYIIIVLAILKAGGAYLPFEGDMAEERVKSILNDVNLRIILTDTIRFNKEPSLFGKMTNIEVLLFDDEKKHNLNLCNKSSSLAYVIYTSGSTGTPKGVMIEHKSINNLALNLRKRFFVDNFNRFKITLIASFTFDASVQQIFASLLFGHTLHICNDELKRKPVLLLKFLQYNSIDIMDCTPTLLKILIEESVSDFKGLSLKSVLVGGEQWSSQLIQLFNLNKLYNANIVFYNVYGPTECCVDTTIYQLQNKEIELVPIGRPIDNQEVYILNNEAQVVPIGISGEICIGGDGLARGYLNKVDLTERVFKDSLELNSKIYLTGDIGKWLADGNIFLSGRKDNQTKIRGYRVELGEIENIILQHESVDSVLVINNKDQEGEDQLIAYYVAKSKLSSDNLRKFISDKLPLYMIPHFFVWVENFPVSAAGKIDYKALAKNTIWDEVEYIEPRNALERQLTKIWQEVLLKDKIGIKDNFFDLGGQSLKAIRIVAKINKELKLKVDFSSILKYPTIETLSSKIERSTSNPEFSIDPVQVSDNYVVSHGQKRLLLLNELDNQSVSYNIIETFSVKGELNVSFLKIALEEIIKKHEVLRTTFKFIKGEYKQKVNNFKKHFFKFVYTNSIKEKTIINNVTKRLLKRKFDLENGPLFKTSLVKVEENEHVLIFCMHHIVSDEWSMVVLLKELINRYEALVKGNYYEDNRLAFQYKDYAVWQNNLFKNSGNDKHRQYWLRKFNGDIPILELPYDFSRPATKTYKGGSVDFLIPSYHADAISEIAKTHDSSNFMLLITVLNILFYKYTGQNDIIIGTPLAGRSHIGLENQIGFYVNTLALRTQFSGSITFLDLLSKVKHNVLKDYSHQGYPFDKLVDDLDYNWESNRNPLFDVIVVLNDAEKRNEFRSIDGFEVEVLKLNSFFSKFDLTLTFTETDNGILLNIIYNKDLFIRKTIEKVCQHFNNILGSVVNDNFQKIRDITFLTEWEKEFLSKVNLTKKKYRKFTVPEVFELQVKQTPHHIAVVYQDRSLSYITLNKQSNRLGKCLHKQYQLHNDDVVAVSINRSEYLAITLLAILKCGGTYVLIDEKLPRERIEYILRHTAAKFLLTNDAGLAALSETIGTKSISLDKLNDSSKTYSDENLNLLSKADFVAYIMYTSGTTGFPKGVMINNKSITNLACNNKGLQIKARNRLLQTGSLSFDASTFEIWGPLLNGGELNLIDQEDLLDSSSLSFNLKRYGINTIWLTSSWFNQLVEDNIELFSELDCVIVGGEKLSIWHIKKIKANWPKLRIINGYGPTEATTFSSLYAIKDIGKDITIPIGKPISNCRIYVADSDFQPVPVGVQGELLIAGDGLAEGYLKDAELTKIKFPNRRIKGQTPERVYRTGDIVRWRADNNLEFLGRRDRQIKIRGFRIELEEIENCLKQQDEITSAIVVCTNNAVNEKIIVAYYVLTDNVSAIDLRQRLVNYLPTYMIPAYFIQLNSLPISLNGKINYNDLPKPFLSHSLKKGLPDDSVQRSIILIWKKILGLSEIDVSDNFFEIGGNSLNAVRAISHLCQEFNVELKLKDLYTHNTTIEMAKLIATKKKKPFKKITQVPLAANYNAAHAQKSIWIASTINDKKYLYNQPFYFNITGNLDIDILKHCFTLLIKRYEILRTTFDFIDNEVKQIVQNDFDFKFTTLDLKNTSEQTIKEIALQESMQPFDFSKDILIRAKILQIDNNEYKLLLTLHHLICDGWSAKILINELIELYNASKTGVKANLKALDIQYKDYANWHNLYIKSDLFLSSRKFWHACFTEKVVPITLPTDFSRPPVKSYRGNTVKHDININQYQLNKMCIDNNVSMFIYLFSAINILIFKYTQQKDIIIAAPISGRNHAQLENQLGNFVNNIALRTKIDPQDNFREFLNKVKNIVITGYEHQDYTFDMLISDLNIKRDPSRFPLVDIGMALHNIQLEDYKILSVDGLTIQQYSESVKTINTDLKFDFSESPENLNLNLDYNTDLFKKETVEEIVENFTGILYQLSVNSSIKLNDIKLLSIKDSSTKQRLATNFHI